MTDTTPIIVPMKVETTDTTIPTSVGDNSTIISFEVDHITSPVQIDFTADAETLAPDEEVSVEYDNKHFHFAIPRGEKGEQGEQGDRGEQGLQGAKGDKGDKGEPGAKGETGATGAQGERGLKGDKGDKGDKGEPGSPGAKGETGAKGDTGATGAKGDDGFSPIATVTKVGKVATISVTDKDGTTTATVSDGEDGTSPDMSLYRTAAEQDEIDDTLLPKTDPAKVTNAIHFGQVDSTSTATKFTATIEGVTEYYDGLTVMLKNGVVTSTTNFTLNINDLGAKYVYTNLAAATRDTTIFNSAYTMLFVYDSTRISGGAWVCYRGYDANTNTIGYQLRTNSTVMNVSDTARYYKLYFTSADGTTWVPASVNSTNNATTARPVNQRPINPFGRIVYTSANTNYAAGANLAAGTIWDQYAFNLGYSFNRTGAALTLSVEKPVYVKCAPQTDGSAIMDADTPIVQALPTTDDGKIYIFLGIAYSATNIELYPNHPVYYYKDGIKLWTGEDHRVRALETLLDNLSPIIGSTEISASDYVTPTQVSAKLQIGATAVILHTDSVFGGLKFSAWNSSAAFNAIVSNTIAYYPAADGWVLIELIGNLTTDKWEVAKGWVSITSF